MWYCDIVILNKKIKTKLVKKFNICDVLDKGGNQTCQFSCGRIFIKLWWNLTHRCRLIAK